jgi:translation elongation factor EF-1alpha
MIAERERGITIDIALWKFETAKYYVTIIDALRPQRFHQDVKKVFDSVHEMIVRERVKNIASY